MLPYDPDVDRIKSIGKVLKNYQSSFDMIKAAEMNYERMRSLNKTTLIQINIQKSVGNIIGKLSSEAVFKNPADAAVSSALAEARATIFARGVGPLEEIPVGDYIQDSIRAKNVITHTQIGPEQRLISQLMQQRSWKKGGGLEAISNKWTEKNQAPGGGDAQTYVTSFPVSSLDPSLGSIVTKNVPPDGVATAGEESTSRRFKNIEVNRQIVALTPNQDGSDKIIKNQYNKLKEYNKASAEPVTRPGFPFAIKNLANNRLVSFPAHIANFNEGVSTSWNNISLINRSEDIYVYQRAERSFNLEFWLFATTDEFEKTENGKGEDQEFSNTIQIDGIDVGMMDKEMMWNRLNFLHTCTRPEYNSKGRFSKAPYCMLYLGDVFHGITTVIDSVNINYDPLLWDINVTDKSKGITPMVALVTLSGKLLHKRAPDAYYKFYGVIS